MAKIQEKFIILLFVWYPYFAARKSTVGSYVGSNLGSNVGSKLGSTEGSVEGSIVVS